MPPAQGVVNERPDQQADSKSSDESSDNDELYGSSAAPVLGINIVTAVKGSTVQGVPRKRISVPIRGETLLFTLTKCMKGCLTDVHKVELLTMEAVYNSINRKLGSYHFTSTSTCATISGVKSGTTPKGGVSFCEIAPVLDVGDVSEAVLSENIPKFLDSNDKLIKCWQRAMEAIRVKATKGKHHVFSPAALLLFYAVQQRIPEFPMYLVINTGLSTSEVKKNIVTSCPMCPNRVFVSEVGLDAAYARLIDHFRNTHKSMTNPCETELPTPDVFRELIWRIIVRYRDSIVRSYPQQN